MPRQVWCLLCGPGAWNTYPPCQVRQPTAALTDALLTANLDLPQSPFSKPELINGTPPSQSPGTESVPGQAPGVVSQGSLLAQRTAPHDKLPAHLLPGRVASVEGAPDIVGHCAPQRPRQLDSTFSVQALLPCTELCARSDCTLPEPCTRGPGARLCRGRGATLLPAWPRRG